jgi:ATP-binding cassette, subfamily B, multidrug efflux pump
MKSLKALRTLNPLFWEHKGKLFAGIFFIALTNILAVFAPTLVAEGVNSLRDANVHYIEPLSKASENERMEIFQQDNAVTIPHVMRWTMAEIEEELGSINSADDLHKLVIAIAIFQALLYMLTFFIKGVFLYFTRQTIIVNSRLMEFSLKKKIYEHYSVLDSNFYKSNDTGDLMNRISEDVSKVRMYMGPAVMYTINLIALIILVVGVMLTIDVKLTLFSLLPLPLMSVGIYFISSEINKLSDTVASKQSNLTSFAQQHVSGIRVLQSYNKESKASDRFENVSDEYKKDSLKLVKIEALFIPIVILLVGLSTVLTIYIGGLKVIEGTLDLGHIFQFIFYVNLLTWPFASVGWVTSLVQKAEASMARILDFLDTQPNLVSGNMTGEASDNSGLVFKNVHFTYPETGISAVRDVSFTIAPGSTVAITGKTGSGKSTITQLAMRMMDPDSGSINFLRTSMVDLHLGKFRERTGYVPQDVFLFSDTIANNIAFGRENASLEMIQTAAEAAGVSKDIEGFTDGYNTMLGERGINLSGGQKQRISIARALIREPELLILDDCLSAVDINTEKHILKSLHKNEVNRSSLVVSHRISTIQDADLILVLDNGFIKERGTHKELAELGGLYAEMILKQDV